MLYVLGIAFDEQVLGYDSQVLDICVLDYMTDDNMSTNMCYI